MWRLDTTDGSWAVKVPFDADSEDEVRLSTAFHEAAYAAGVPTPQVRRTTDGAVFATSAAGRSGSTSGSTCALPTPTLDPALVGAAVAAIHRVEVAHDGALAPVVRTSRSAPTAGTSWSSSCAPREHRSRAGWPSCATSWSRSSRGSSRRGSLRTCHRDLWADNVLPDRRRRRVRHRLGEQRTGRSRARSSGCVLFEFGRNDPGRARALADAYRERRRAGARSTGPATSRC